MGGKVEDLRWQLDDLDDCVKDLKNHFVLQVEVPVLAKVDEVVLKLEEGVLNLRVLVHFLEGKERVS